MAPMAARWSRAKTSSSAMPLARDAGSMSRAPSRKPTAMPTPWGEMESGPMWTWTIGWYEMADNANGTPHSCPPAHTGPRP